MNTGIGNQVQNRLSWELALNERLCLYKEIAHFTTSSMQSKHEQLLTQADKTLMDYNRQLY